MRLKEWVWGKKLIGIERKIGTKKRFLKNPKKLIENNRRRNWGRNDKNRGKIPKEIMVSDWLEIRSVKNIKGKEV